MKKLISQLVLAVIILSSCARQPATLGPAIPETDSPQAIQTQLARPTSTLPVSQATPTIPAIETAQSTPTAIPPTATSIPTPTETATPTPVPIIYTPLEQQVIDKTKQAIQAYLAKNDIGNIASASGQTLNSIYDQTDIGNEDKQLEALELICGKMPQVPDKPNYTQMNAVGSWRFCAAVSSYSLSTYHETIGDDARLASDIYMIIFQYDSIAGTDKAPPLHGLAGWQYRIGNYGFSASAIDYLNDSGMGVFSGLGWYKTLGKVPKTYCTQLEKPYDTGKNCKTIDLQKRIAKVAMHMIRVTDDFRSFRQDAHWLAWNANGRAAEAIATGDPEEIAARLKDANSLVGNEQKELRDYSPSQIVPWKYIPLVYADTYQHLGVLVRVNDFDLPDNVLANAKKFYDAYTAVYFNSRFPLADIADNSYNIKAAKNMWGSDKVLNYCNSDKNRFHTMPGSSVTTWVRGEHLSDALITTGQALYNLLKLSDQDDLAQIVLQQVDQSLDSIIRVPIDWKDENCVQGSIYGPDSGPKVHLKIALREVGFLFQSLHGYERTPLGSYGNQN